MTPRERWQVGLGVLTAYVGPAERRAADITRLAGDRDPREVLFGVLAVAKDLLGLLATSTDLPPAELLQHLAGGAAGQSD
ncbi:MAG: hypothetical protein M3Y91_18650 [Actinomycetota bacterium]|nr:hypothetical protein [Actinomycetota bacterium]